MTFYKLFERSINEILKFRKFIHKKRKRKFRVIEDNKRDAEFIAFLEKFRSDQQKSVIRDINYFNWVIDFPWVLKGKTDKESERYFFSSKSEQFEYRILKIYNHQQLEGIVLLKIRDKNLTVSHMYAKDEHIGSIAGYLIDLSLNELINTISTIDHRLMNRLRAKRTNFIYIKNFKRPYIFPRNYDIASSVFQDGDGDAVFT